ncbi:hypothetical protein PoB_003844700 [Plakobranchus ocellatus]|uniref:Uncharacterized protein n=1 Tax=Plakobranchus ocellatus TaxID=259542 RepID=A0AAV4AYE6_9GAST|nr:hypothetical protein PoB_003844700 [Plakobranchus ocellatus]
MARRETPYTSSAEGPKRRKLCLGRTTTGDNSLASGPELRPLNKRISHPSTINNVTSLAAITPRHARTERSGPIFPSSIPVWSFLLLIRKRYRYVRPWTKQFVRKVTIPLTATFHKSVSMHRVAARRCKQVRHVHLSCLPEATAERLDWCELRVSVVRLKTLNFSAGCGFNRQRWQREGASLVYGLFRLFV